MEGIKSLYDAIEKMPKRPAWTAYFLPANVKVDKVKKSLETIEKKFFAGEALTSPAQNRLKMNPSLPLNTALDGLSVDMPGLAD